jgi:glycosyltransferase involved in cell wall biosynthesis
MCRSRRWVRIIEFFFRKLIYAHDGSGKKRLWDEFLATVMEKSLALPVAEKFLQDPSEFLGTMAIVLDRFTDHHKGLLLLKYSYSFPLFLALFDIAKVTERFDIVLEPSWTGYCDGSILSYAGLDTPVYVQSLEPKDSAFLRSVADNLIPVEIGANWWIDHRVFRPYPDVAKDTDICVIASWAKFKRHDEIFHAVAAAKRKGIMIKLLLLGYQIDMTLDDIFKLAKETGIERQIEMYEKLSPPDVAKQICRCKANLVWSKREGVNKAIIEGFLCDVPGILREGFNYGYRYNYMNPETGVYSSTCNLVHCMVRMIGEFKNYHPRQWVLNNMTCQHAVERIAEVRSERIPGFSSEENRCVAKVNALDGMSYFNPSDRNFLDAEYCYLMQCAVPQHG